MSDVFEVAFSGQIAPGADLEQVKKNIGSMFKADEAKLAQLFSGKRIVIKKNIDQQTALKYQAAMQKAGAVCEVRNLSAPTPQSTPEPAAPAVSEPVPATQPAREAVDYADRDIPPAPQTVPLDIRGEQIADLAANLAPVGSMMQDQPAPDVPPPAVPDGITMAPVGSDLGVEQKKNEPPPPDTGGLSLVDN